MVSFIVPLNNELKNRLETFPWVNWSEVVRESLMQKEIFEGFIRTGKLSNDDHVFCKRMDWHPTDWLPLRDSFVSELKKASNGRFVKMKSPRDLF